MMGFWVLAIRDNRYWASAAFGAVLSLATFFSYTLLVLGAFVVGYAAIEIVRHPRAGAIRVLVHSTIVLGVVAGLYAMLWLATGFDPIRTFLAAVANQQRLLEHLVIPRP